MSIIAGIETVSLAIKAIDKVVDLFPDFEQRQRNEWKHLKDQYELEQVKPRWNPSATPEENQLARSEDRLLNLRDECLRYGETLLEQTRPAKG